MRLQTSNWHRWTRSKLAELNWNLRDNFSSIGRNVAIWLANLSLSVRVWTTLLASTCHTMLKLALKHGWLGNFEVDIVVETRHGRVSPQQILTLCWRISLSIRLKTTQNHCRFVKSTGRMLDRSQTVECSSFLRLTFNFSWSQAIAKNGARGKCISKQEFLLRTRA